MRFLCGLPGHFTRLCFRTAPCLFVTLQAVAFLFIRLKKSKLAAKTLLLHEARLHRFNTLLLALECTLGEELDQGLLIESHFRYAIGAPQRKGYLR